MQFGIQNILSVVPFVQLMMLRTERQSRGSLLSIEKAPWETRGFFRPLETNRKESGMTEHHEKLIRLFNEAVRIGEELDKYLDEIIESGLNETGVHYHADQAWKSLYE